MNKTNLLAIIIFLASLLFLVSCVGPDTEFSWYEESETYSNESTSNVSEESEIASEETEDEFVSEFSLEEKVSLPFVPFE